MIETREQTAPQGKANLGDVEMVVRPVLNAHGLDLFDLSFRAERGGWVLRVIIDTLDSDSPDEHVSVDQCADVSRDLSAALDVADPLPIAYTLEVSSPGVERPLRRHEDYCRFKGRTARLALKSPVEGVGTVIQGSLGGVEDDVVKVNTGQPELLSIPISDIKRANLVYEMPRNPKKGTSKKKRRPKGRRD